VVSAVFGLFRFASVNFGIAVDGFTVEAVDWAGVADCADAPVDLVAEADEAAAGFETTALLAGMVGFAFTTDFEDLLAAFDVEDFVVVEDFDVFAPEVLFLNQPTIPVGAGFDPFAAGCSAVAFSAQMTPIISATRHLRSIRAPSMESADRPVFRIGGRFQ
jgi:hypothetical protein